MNAARLLLLVLAMLLPFRGAVAEALVCAGHAGHGAPAVTNPDTRHAAHHGGAPVLADSACEPAAAAAAAHGEGHATTQHDGAGAQSQCNTCAAGCSMWPLLGIAPSVPAAESCPDRHASHRDAPAPVHLTDGQERPPRSV